MTTTSALQRNTAVDLAKSVAIFGTLLIHTSASGGFAWEVGSASWMANLFWNCLIRCAVPVFFLCSGALLLPPEKTITPRQVWCKYIPRMLFALLFWAAAYAAWPLVLTKLRGGVVEAVAIRNALKGLLLFHHKTHLYYLHIILLVYAVLPLTRLFAQRADRTLMRYALLLWFVLSSVVPCLRTFPPLSLIGGIPAQYPINLTWGAVGYTLLGYELSHSAKEKKPAFYLGLYLLGFAVTFGGTWAMSVHTASLYQIFLQGNAPGVCLQAAGIYGFCVSFCAAHSVPRAVETVSRASFCVFLVHLFFLDELVLRGYSAGFYPPVWAVPALTLAIFAASFAVWLVLRHIPVVNKYLI